MVIKIFFRAIGCTLLMLGMPVFAKPTRAFTKPPVLPQAQQFELETAPDLSVLAKKLAQAPVSPLNARKLLKIYEYCGFFAGPKTRKEWMDLFLPSVKADDPFHDQRIALANTAYNRCEALLIESPDPFEVRATWLKKADAGGDIVAKLTLRQLTSPTEKTIAGFEAELKSALNSTDPEAIWEAGRAISLAGFGWSNLSTKPWPDKEVDSLRAVFQLAACELGMPCGAQSNLMTHFCIRGTCDAKSYDQWLATFLTANQYQAVKAELPRVLKEIKSGRGAALIFH